MRKRILQPNITLQRDVNGLVFSMDKMVGGKFEDSLAALKTVTERVKPR
jgi:hypothetical protein